MPLSIVASAAACGHQPRPERHGAGDTATSSTAASRQRLKRLLEAFVAALGETVGILVGSEESVLLEAVDDRDDDHDLTTAAQRFNEG